MNNFIELLKTTLTTEIKMSFGMFVGSTIIVILMTIFAGAIGLLLV